MFTENCSCGDVFDEHDPETLECLVAGCDCVHFDADEDPEIPSD